MDTFMSQYNMQEKFVKLNQKLNYNRVFIEKPKKLTFPNGNEIHSSKIHYKDKNGDKTKLYFELETQYCFAISTTYKYGIKRNEQNINNINGYQLQYPLTSSETIKNPTCSEKHVFKIFQ